MTLSIIIPAYNEESALGDVLHELITWKESHKPDLEIIVVDDGSTDQTAEIAERAQGITCIRHRENRGYGQALTTGVTRAKSEWCMTYDADGQHTPDLIEFLMTEMTEENDLVVGKRVHHKGPLIRQPGKWVIRKIAEYLVEKKIPDLNSGLRAFRREAFLSYCHLFPNGFSLSTTSTVCFLKERKTVVFVPIEIQERIGKSTVSPRDGVKALMLVLRLIMLFSPLRIFLPLSTVLGIATIILLARGLIVYQDISDSGVILISLTAILFFFGLLADQVAALRREVGKRSV